VLPPLQTSEHVDNWLKKMQDRFPKELTESEIEDWQRDLGSYPIAAIDFAFDTHRRNARFFPNPVDILELCRAWQPMQGNYKKIPASEYGKGYSDADMLWLYHRYFAQRNSLPNRPMTDSEIDKLLDELDKHRGRKPAWKVA
jgi:hypothetical protein